MSSGRTDGTEEPCHCCEALSRISLRLLDYRFDGQGPGRGRTCCGRPPRGASGGTGSPAAETDPEERAVYQLLEPTSNLYGRLICARVHRPAAAGRIDSQNPLNLDSGSIGRNRWIFGPAVGPRVPIAGDVVASAVPGHSATARSHAGKRSSVSRNDRMVYPARRKSVEPAIDHGGTSNHTRSDIIQAIRRFDFDRP